jgi:hypothetical protein
VAVLAVHTLAQIQDTLHFLIQAVAVAVAQVQALQLMPAALALRVQLLYHIKIQFL